MATQPTTSADIFKSTNLLAYFSLEQGKIIFESDDEKLPKEQLMILLQAVVLEHLKDNVKKDK